MHLLATTSIFLSLILAETAPPVAPAAKFYVCSTKEPPQVDRTLDELQKSPLLTKNLDINTLSTAEIQSVQAITGMIQQGVERRLMWDQGATLRIAFLNGDLAIQQRIKQSAMKWTDKVNIKFLFVDDPQTADIRIGIDLNGKSESQVGKAALDIDKAKETMHFGWLTTASSIADYDRVVLHEFGHALGMLHEHQIPSSTIIWNRAFVYQYCQTQWGWTSEDVDHNIFEKYTPEQAIFTRMDPLSIMMYSFPAEWSSNTPPISTPWNYQISDGDQQFMTLRYPQRSAPPPPPL